MTRRDIEAKLKWLGHMVRMDSGHNGQSMLKIKLPGRRKKRMIAEEVYGCNESSRLVLQKWDGVRWRQMTGCRNAQQGKQKYKF